jgi:hypothetical protein
MIKFKVLPLMFPFSADKAWWGNIKLVETIPFFDRDGFYLDRYDNSVWFEKEGRAYLYGSREWFEQELYILDDKVMDDRLFEALRTLISFRRATKKQTKLFLLEDMKRSVARLSKESKLYYHRYNKNEHD